MNTLVQGKACKYGHDGLRYKSGGCAHCRREMGRSQNASVEFKESAKAAKKRYLAKPEKMAAAKARHARWRKSEKGKLSMRAYHLKANLGITIEQFDAMVIAQRNACAICGKSGAAERNGLLSVDHDHETGAARGLLCDACNVGLGRFGDDVDLVEKAAAYLRVHKGG